MVLYDFFQGDIDVCDDKDDFVMPVPKKKEVKPTDLIKSPFVTEFGSSMEVLNQKKQFFILKDLIPFSLKITEALRFDRQTEFDLWIEVGLKKKNKYVMVNVQYFLFIQFFF